MTYPLDEPFDDALGRWNEYAPWDATEYKDDAKGFLATQSHVDLRVFRVMSELVPVPQKPDLTTVSQTTLDSEVQTSLEEKPGLTVVNENWTLAASGGVTGLTVGKIAARGGWSGLQLTTTGAAIAATLESVLPTRPINISSGTHLSTIFPDYNTFDGTSYIQLTSDPNGTWGNGHDSAQVAFSANASIMPQMSLLISSFAQSGFDNTKVTGVRIHLVKAVAPSAGLTITIMAMRALPAAWTESALDFDTTLGVICVPVTLDGAVYGGTVAKNFEFVRGDGSHLDPIPADLAMNMYFYPGGGTSPNDATGTNYNKIGFIFREIKSTGAGTGSHIEARYLFNDTATKFEVERIDTTGGAEGTVTVLADNLINIDGSPDPNKHYLFRVEVRGTQIEASLWQTDIVGDIISLEWKLDTTITEVDYVYRNGRVGFVADLLTRDAYINKIEAAATGFATLTTQVYSSRTPVDGAQLSAICSPDLNLFNSASAPDLLIDQTKTLSGAGSYRTSQGITTNDFIADDWTQMYLDLAIWVPANVTLKNQPQITLNSAFDVEPLVVPKLQPAQWNKLHFDLGMFRSLVTGSTYSFSVAPSDTPDKPLGNFWVDGGMVIGRRRVAWSVRATPNGPFRLFGDAVNNPSGAVHFKPDERGTSLQLRAVALTQDAWVSSFKLFPRYAQLGLPVYDQGFETR